MFARDFAERDEDIRLDRGDLSVEIPSAVGEFFFCRIAVLRRATPDAVGDPNLFPEDADLAQGGVEDAARPADKGFALLVFVLARPLADKQEIGIVRPNPVDDPTSGVDEFGAPLAVLHTETVELLHSEQRVGSGLILRFFRWVEELLATGAGGKPGHAQGFGSTAPLWCERTHDGGGHSHGGAGHAHDHGVRTIDGGDQ